MISGEGTGVDSTIPGRTVAGSYGTSTSIKLLPPLFADIAPIFGGVPVVLMAQDNRGRPTYYGRPDISRFMASVPLRAIPWREYTIN